MLRLRGRFAAMRRRSKTSAGRGWQKSSAVAAQKPRRGNMPTGTVKWFNDEKGFGFLASDEGGRDLFVHHSNINSDGYRSLAEGSKGSYEEEAGPKGPKVINNVRL